jgi:hypothetical protein
VYIYREKFKHLGFIGHTAEVWQYRWRAAEFAKIVSLYVLVDLWLSTCGTLFIGSIFAQLAPCVTRCNIRFR